MARAFANNQFKFVGCKKFIENERSEKFSEEGNKNLNVRLERNNELEKRFVSGPQIESAFDVIIVIFAPNVLKGNAKLTMGNHS